VVFGLTFFVEVAAVDVVYYRNAEVSYLQAAKGFSAKAPRRAIRQGQK
jgi:hypothetical protein